MRYRSTHEQRLERWLGAEQVSNLQQAMRNWYGPPIAVAGVPGVIWAYKGGDFVGTLAGGGFTSLSDLIAEATAGKGRYFTFLKSGPTGVVNVSSSLIQLGLVPPAAANAAAAPGGIAETDATTGYPAFANPTNPDTQHVTTSWTMASVASQTLLLFDCLFRVNKTMNSTAVESVTGIPTRYQNTVAGSADSAEGNFLFVQVGLTVLAATAHNWTVCLYLNQGGAAGTLPSLTGNASAIVHRLDHPVGQWFAPLAAGDTGVKELDQMQASALVATGVINFVIGHPIAWFPHGSIANQMMVHDGINSAFNLVRIFDDAALALMQVNAAATTATTYNATIKSVAG